MKQAILLFLFALSALSLFGQTQLEMNNEANQAYQQADQELNRVYNQVLKRYQNDAIFLKNLKAAQRLWMQFRNAELAMKYPKREPGYYGSMHPLCVANYLKELTDARTQTLKTWLSGAEEGDVCAGTIKLR